METPDPLEQKVSKVLRQRPYSYEEALAEHQQGEDHWQRVMDLSDQQTEELLALQGANLKRASEPPPGLFDSASPSPPIWNSRRVASRRFAPAWGGAVAALLVVGIGFSVYLAGQQPGRPPEIQAVNPRDLNTYTADMANALEVLARLPESGTAELEVRLRLSRSGASIQGAPQVIRVTDPAIRDAAFQAITSLQETGLPSWRKAGDGEARLKVVFDGKAQQVRISTQPSTASPETP